MFLIECSIVTLLPCEKPPSIRLQVKNATNQRLFDGIVNRSTEVFVGVVDSINIYLDIMLDNSIAGQIGLEVRTVASPVPPPGSILIFSA